MYTNHEPQHVHSNVMSVVVQQTSKAKAVLGSMLKQSVQREAASAIKELGSLAVEPAVKELAVERTKLLPKKRSKKRSPCAAVRKMNEGASWAPWCEWNPGKWTPIRDYNVDHGRQRHGRRRRSRRRRERRSSRRRHAHTDVYAHTRACARAARNALVVAQAEAKTQGALIAA